MGMGSNSIKNTGQGWASKPWRAKSAGMEERLLCIDKETGNEKRKSRKGCASF
jgi:hypothetical protein